MNVLIALLSVALFTTTSCCLEVSRSSVPGTYVATLATGIDTIVVRADGTYSHLFSRDGGPGEESGTWDLERVEGAPRISFHKFTPQWERGARQGIWAARVQRTLHTMRLRISDDLNLYYERR